MGQPQIQALGVAPLVVVVVVGTITMGVAPRGLAPEIGWAPWGWYQYHEKVAPLVVGTIKTGWHPLLLLVPGVGVVPEGGLLP